MPAINQKQLQSLLQKLSPQQIQMIKLLELPAIQLEQRIKQEIEENPVLDEDAPDELTDEDAGKKDLSVDELDHDETPAYKYRTNNYSKDDNHYQSPLAAMELSMRESLVEQLDYIDLGDRDKALAAYIIESIDDDGYLRRDLEDIANDMAFSVGIDVSVQELDRLLNVIHNLEPKGIGARDLRECLLLQLESRDKLSAAQELAERILTSYFEEFKRKHYEKLASRLGVGERELSEAIEEIRKLSPKPGNLFSNGRNESIPYVVPDFILDYNNGAFELALNSRNTPQIKISDRYLEMMRNMPAGRRSDSDREATQFVKNKIESAKWFIKAIQQRNDTLLRTMSEILDYQREYFRDGDVGKLRPMILKDIADRTGLDVSTISRVVNSKYIQTHFGILPLKQLFSEALETEDGEAVSSHRIKNFLQECLENEDKRKPLTDEELMEMLNAEGYKIARRTVAKYREMLGIPVARLRKTL